MDESDIKDWSRYVLDLRCNLNLSQEGLAEKLRTNQCTVSRGERNITMPNYGMRKKLSELGSSTPQNSSTDEDQIAAAANHLFACSAFPSILIRRDGLIVAVSPGMDYRKGLTLADQTSPEELDLLDMFETFLQETEFWKSPNTCFAFQFRSNNQDCCNILTSIELDGKKYCLVQKKLPALSWSYA